MNEIKATPTNQLRRNSLGLIAVTFMVISAAAPLTGVAGAMPLAFLLGNGTGIPLIRRPPAKRQAACPAHHPDDQAHWKL